VPSTSCFAGTGISSERPGSASSGVGILDFFVDWKNMHQE
jgi:hypothetical protein